MKFNILKRKISYKGFFIIERINFQYELFKGGMSKPVVREVFERGNSVAVLPYDPRSNKVVLIEQFRVAAIKDEKSPWLLEIIAGVLEEGESPEQVARREAKEEADCELGNLKFICKYFTSPGGTSEQVWVYAATFDASKLAPGIHGLPKESEDIRVHILPTAEAWERLEKGEIKNSPAIIALQWLQLNKTQLQCPA